MTIIQKKHAFERIQPLLLFMYTLKGPGDKFFQEVGKSLTIKIVSK